MVDINDLFGGAPLPEADCSRLRAHVEALVAEHDLKWIEDETLTFFLGAHGLPESREIKTPLLTSELAYWTAVHEVGHFALGINTYEQDGVTVSFDNELNVWRWALDEAIILPSGKGGTGINSTFHSYANDDPPQHAPFELIESLRELVGTEGDEPMRYKS